MCLERGFVDDQHGSRAVADLAGVGGGDDPAVLEGSHRTDRFQGGIAANALIMHMDMLVACRVLHRNGNDLVIESPGIDSRHGTPVAFKREPVERFAVESIFGRHHLRAGELAELGDAEPLPDMIGKGRTHTRIGGELRRQNMGTRVMLSIPAAMTTSCVPDMTACAANWIACCEEPHCRSIVTAGTVSGRREARTA